MGSTQRHETVVRMDINATIECQVGLLSCVIRQVALVSLTLTVRPE